ncbi:MAG: hypothetical protein V4573_19490 [Pseudomonadota bacterium]
MNSKFIASTVIALSALTGASAFAQDAQTHLYGEAALAIRPVTTFSNVTRAEVQASNVNPGQNGEAAANAWARNQTVASTVTRAEVRNEAVVAARTSQAGNSTI